jgi:ATP-dependent Clp protease adaptor protein ClpS
MMGFNHWICSESRTVEKFSARGFMMNVAVAEETEVAPPKVRPKKGKKSNTDKRRKRQPPYVVIIENDDFHTFAYVIEVIQRVCGRNQEDAFLLTTQIHLSGRACVWTGTRELAELKCDQIRGFGPDFHAEETVKFPLGVTIEPLPSD